MIQKYIKLDHSADMIWVQIEIPLCTLKLLRNCTYLSFEVGFVFQNKFLEP